MSDFIQSDIEKAEMLLRPMMPDRFAVSYEPAMAGSDGKLFRWFQVFFAVGPGDIEALRKQVHELFPKMLATLSPLASVHEADHVTLRARRFIPDLDSDRPFMFIQADWKGDAVRRMRNNGDFSVWANECLTYRNEHDKHDAFNKQVSVCVTDGNSLREPDSPLREPSASSVKENKKSDFISLETMLIWAIIIVVVLFVVGLILLFGFGFAGDHQF